MTTNTQIVCIAIIVAATILAATGEKTIYDFTVNDIKGNPVDLGKYRGKVSVDTFYL